MYSNAARLGDATTRGQIVTATSTMLDDNRPVALTGDKATCSECKGAFPISGTGTGMSERGLPVVVAGDLVLCRCDKNRVLPGMNAGILLEPSTAATVANYEAVSHLSGGSGLNTAPMKYDETIVLKDEAGIPVANQKYKITTEDGEVYEGVTDDLGRTDVVRTAGAKKITVEMVV